VNKIKRPVVRSKALVKAPFDMAEQFALHQARGMAPQLTHPIGRALRERDSLDSRLVNEYRIAKLLGRKAAVMPLTLEEQDIVIIYGLDRKR
jgi:hypothetical protein